MLLHWTLWAFKIAGYASCEMSSVVVACKRPGVVKRPFSYPGVQRHKPGSGSRSGYAEHLKQRGLDKSSVRHRNHGITGEFLGHPVEEATHPDCEHRPTLTLGSEWTIWFSDHVELTVACRMLIPWKSIGHAGVHFLKVFIVPDGCAIERGFKDKSCLTCSKPWTAQQHGRLGQDTGQPKSIPQ